MSHPPRKRSVRIVRRFASSLVATGECSNPAGECSNQSAECSNLLDGAFPKPTNVPPNRTEHSPNRTNVPSEGWNILPIGWNICPVGWNIRPHWLEHFPLALAHFPASGTFPGRWKRPSRSGNGSPERGDVLPCAGTIAPSGEKLRVAPVWTKHSPAGTTRPGGLSRHPLNSPRKEKAPSRGFPREKTPALRRGEIEALAGLRIAHEQAAVAGELRIGGRLGARPGRAAIRQPGVSTPGGMAPSWIGTATIHPFRD